MHILPRFYGYWDVTSRIVFVLEQRTFSTLWLPCERVQMASANCSSILNELQSRQTAY